MQTFTQPLKLVPVDHAKFPVPPQIIAAEGAAEKSLSRCKGWATP